MQTITAATTASTSAATASAAPSPRLVHAAHEFEAQMMQELLKPMTSGDGLDGEDSESASGSSGALGSFASESLGQALSERGGFGIATGIMRQLSVAGNKHGTTGITGRLHANTQINSRK